MSWHFPLSDKDKYLMSKYIEHLGSILTHDCSPDDPGTAICPQCGDTAYMDDDGSYVCVECGNEFEGGED